MTTVTLLLLFLAAVAFAAATLGIQARVNLVALGLLAVTLTLLIPALA